jgi:uncharacterized protein YbjT (DUF2867 family)
MILVTGATGNVGSELVKILVDGRHPVCGLVRSPRPLPADARAVVGNLDDAASLRKAAKGARGVFLLGGYADMPGALSAFRDAGVEHIALLSSRSVIGGKESNAVTGMHMAAERAVRESGLAWTFVRASGFMSNALQWVPQLQAGDLVREPFADVPIAAIDPYDIAAVAATALTEHGHAGRAYAITGPEAILPGDRLQILAKLLGRDLRLEAITNDVAREEMSRTTPPTYVDAFFRFFAEGEFDDSSVTPTVRDITGQQPRSFADWATAHLDAFAAPGRGGADRTAGKS